MLGTILFFVSAFLRFSQVGSVTLSLDLLEGSPNTTCYNGWIRYGDSCYAYGESDISHADAAAVCAQFNAHLAVPDSGILEENFIKDFAFQRQVSMWIGITDLFQEGLFSYMSSRIPVPFEVQDRSWAVGEPNNVNNEDCVVVNGGKDSWNDFNCNRQEFFLCERRVVANVSDNVLLQLTNLVTASLS